MSGAICPAVFVTSSPLTWGNSRWVGFFAQRGWDVLTWPGKLFNWWSRVTPRQRTAMHSWLHHPDTTSTQPRLEWMGFHGFLFGDVFFCAKEIVVTRIHVYIEIPIVSWGMCGLLTSSHLQAFPVTTGGVSCEDWFSFGMASLCIYIYMHTHTYIYIHKYISLWGSVMVSRSVIPHKKRVTESCFDSPWLSKPNYFQVRSVS